MDSCTLLRRQVTQNLADLEGVFHVFTGGSVRPSGGISTAAFGILAVRLDRAGSSNMTSSVHVLCPLHGLHKAVVFTDSRFTLVLLLSDENNLR